MTPKQLIKWWEGNGVRATIAPPHSFWGMMQHHALYTIDPFKRLRLTLRIVRRLEKVRALLPQDHPLQPWLKEGVWDDFKSFERKPQHRQRMTLAIEDKQEIVMEELRRYDP